MKTNLSEPQLACLKANFNNIDLRLSDQEILRLIDERFKCWSDTDIENIQTAALESAKEQLTKLFEIAIEIRKTVAEAKQKHKQLVANIKGLIADYEGGLS